MRVAYQDLTLLDRFLFAEVMEDPKTFENILSIILGEDISIKGRPQSEHESRTSPLKRQVRLDVWAEDETDAVYNVEAQKENTKNLPHRSRFYQALIDSKLLISCSTSRLQEIKNHVNIVKSSEEIGVKYMQEWEEKILEKRKARAEGLAEGRAEGETFRLIQLIKKKIQKSKSFIQIADELEEEPDNIQSLYECISQNINLTTEEIYKIYISPDKTED